MHSVIPANFISQASRRSSTDRERNCIAAIFSFKVVILLIMALAVPSWYYLKGGGCSRQVLGTEQFFYVNSVKTLTVPSDGVNSSYSKLAYYGLDDGKYLNACYVIFYFINIFFSIFDYIFFGE